MPTKFILAMIGVKGSGKSVSLRKLGMLLLGDKFNVFAPTSDPKNFEAAITNNFFVVLDNADNRVSWLEDILAIVATGGTIQKRLLYTTNKSQDFPITAFLAITSRTHTLARDDISERLLILKLCKFQHYINENDLLDEVNKNRNYIMYEVVHYLQEVTRALKECKDVRGKGQFRMADFENFVTKIAHFAGIRNEIEEIFKKLIKEQSIFTLEHDEVFILMMDWIEKKANPGRWITNKDLCQELSTLADKKGDHFIFKGKVNSFVQKMKNIRINLNDFFIIKDQRGRARTIHYSYRLKVNQEKDTE